MAKEPTYELTPKGYVSLETNDAGLTDAILDSLELAARRKECNALLIDDEGWKFIKVEKANEANKKTHRKTVRR